MAVARQLTVTLPSRRNIMQTESFRSVVISAISVKLYDNWHVSLSMLSARNRLLMHNCFS